MNLIDTTEELQKACKILKKQKLIAIDCEFIREKTYYPVPCLIQVGYEDGAFLFDPLAKKMDFKDFFALLQNKKILKIFHSGRQDIEILYNLSKEIPTPVFDTQIAAQACGLGECVSYENLVRVYCEKELDKSCRLTNWQLRPLSAEQLEYAAADVTHLIPCYKKIAEYIKENNREEWISADMEDIVNIAHYNINPEEAWLRIRHNSHSVTFLNALKALAAWREKTAMKHNITRNNILKDDMLINIATAFPKTMEEMQCVRGLRSDIAKSKYAKEIVEILSNLTDDKFDKKLGKFDRDREVTLSPSMQSLYEILRLLLKIKSHEYGVVSRLIATDKTLREYIKNPKGKHEILSGWRYEIFGKTAVDFCKGKLAISYDAKSRDIVIKDTSC